MKAIDWIAIVLLIVGGINWGLVGFFGFDLVNWIFGVGALSDWIKGFVGISAVYSIYSLWKAQK